MKRKGPDNEWGVSISERELKLLTIAAQFEGLDYLLGEFKKAGAENVVDGVENTLKDNTYDDNVLGTKDQAVVLYGLSYEGDPNDT